MFLRRKNNMFVFISDFAKRILSCPLCKSEIKECHQQYKCFQCGIAFPKIEIPIGSDMQNITYDFRLHRPDYSKNDFYEKWEATDDQFKKLHTDSVQKDNYEEYLAEIDSVKEIYTNEFHLSGSVLDVGGHQGRLRHYLSKAVEFYVSIDPFAAIFDNIALQKNLLKAYPSLITPCNFFAAHAETLPFKANTFDWIHMRSVIDHFYDPYIALLEAFRCAKPGGNLLIGLAIMEKYYATQVIATEPPLEAPEKPAGLKGVLKKCFGKKNVAFLWAVKNGFIESYFSPIFSNTEAPECTNTAPAHDGHMFHFGHKQLHELCSKAGWRLVKEHWQKEPFSFCLYAHYTVDKG